MSLKMNLSELEKRVEQKLITKQKHPEFPLWIYNYSQSCQFNKVWDDYTLMCRGLILDEQGNVIARPFPKFFNLEELEGLGIKLPDLPYEIQQKYDGSLGISYFWEGKMYLATRGSFTSDQSAIGTHILQEDYAKVPVSSKHTYLFEIIYPSNRIVVDYGDMTDLVLLAVCDTETGKEINVNNFSFRLRETIPNTALDKLKELAKPNSEGFVIRFSDGFRVKLKFDEYVRLHRIMTGVNKRRVWDVLRSGDSLDEYLKGVPEEFENWINATKGELLGEYEHIEAFAKNAFGELMKVTNSGEDERKQQALWIMDNAKEFSGILFKMLDGADYSELIWKMIKPESTTPFKVEI